LLTFSFPHVPQLFSLPVFLQHLIGDQTKIVTESGSQVEKGWETLIITVIRAVKCEQQQICYMFCKQEGKQRANYVTIIWKRNWWLSPQQLCWKASLLVHIFLLAPKCSKLH